MEGCPGPTAAWHGGTENPSVWGTLHLLCSAHSTIDMRLPFVLSTKTIQVSPDRSRSPRTQYLTAAHVQMCREQKSLRRCSCSRRGAMKDPCSGSFHPVWKIATVKSRLTINVILRFDDRKGNFIEMCEIWDLFYSK